jgi:phenylalanyl-tRNA synthetase beta chain
MEFGHIFHESESDETIVAGFAEHTSLLLAVSGPRENAFWDASTQESGIYDLKGVVASLLTHLGVQDAVMEAHYDSTSVTRYHLALTVGGQNLGILAMLSDGQREAYDLKAPVYFAEINWDAVVTLAEPALYVRYQAISRFPVVERDLAVVLDRGQDVGPLMETIKAAGGALVQDVSVFDVYTGDRIEAAKKSVAFGIRFGAHRTLKDREVDQSIDAMVKALNQAYGAELRQ